MESWAIHVTCTNPHCDKEGHVVTRHYRDTMGSPVFRGECPWCDQRVFAYIMNPETGLPMTWDEIRKSLT